jgi:hypothetical protein
MKPDMEKIYIKLNHFVKSDADKLSLCATSFGTAAQLTKFLIENVGKIAIPLDIYYLMLLTSINVIALRKDEPFEFNETLNHIEMPTEEKLKFIIKEIVEKYKYLLD